MAHLRDVNARQHTVLMVQVENEVGMIPNARDHSRGLAVRGAVPQALIRSHEPRAHAATLNHAPPRPA
jgi:hypothetical protein